MVKKRASRPWKFAGIPNAFLWAMFPTMLWVRSTLEFFPTDGTDPGILNEFVDKIVWVIYGFDMTLGFPGEGPKWSVISANVDSFATNFNCLQWDADVFMIQEARAADSNLVLSLSVKLQCAISTFSARSPFRSNALAMAPFVFRLEVQQPARTRNLPSCLMRRRIFLVPDPCSALQHGSPQHGTKCPLG